MATKQTTTESCAICEIGTAQLGSYGTSRTVGGKTYRVKSPGWKCNTCGDIYYHPGQVDLATIAVIGRIREQEGLLSPTAIKSFREGLGLSQDKFEHLLGVGPKTVVRWERGTVCQQKSTDELLRLLMDVPEALAHQAASHGIVWRGAPAPAPAKPKRRKSTATSTASRRPVYA